MGAGSPNLNPTEKEKMSFRPLLLSRHSFLGRRISRHLREFHSEKSGHSRKGGSVSRRNFLTNAAGTAGLAFWIPQPAQAGQGQGKSADPKPIPGGVSPLGIFIHHFPAQPTATPLQALNEPSQITDFKGFVGLNRIRGAGTGSGFADTLAFQADMGFMKGVFIAEDGNLHQGVFGFI
jgi:hypothetical protein